MQKNIKLVLSWNGAQFSGYQYQPHAFTVQEALTKAWRILAREDVTFIGCSRLDAGVHASHFVLNFFSHTTLSEEDIIRRLNGILHGQLQLDISVYSAEFVSLKFHARHDTIAKHYRYLIWYGFGQHALLTKKSWYIRSKIGLNNIAEVFKRFEGEHQFGAYRATDCSAQNTLCHLMRIDTWFHPLYKELCIIDFWGDRFLKNMIRNLVGTAIEVATEKLSTTAIDKSFEHQDRCQMGMCAPPWALTLMDVYYERQKLEEKIKSGAQSFVV